jgi:hypothetical protein
MDQPGTLIKFGKLEHLQQLLNDGLLYLNNLPYFWKIEDDELRGDPFDCAIQVVRGPKVTMAVPGGKEVILCTDYTMRITPQEPEKINIFCMYALRPLIEGTFPVDAKNFRFGDHALLLMNRDEFMQRLEAKLKSERVMGEADLVEYVDDKYTEKLGPFRKFNRFSYQHEWRLVCYDGPGNHREVRIGSIRDIAVILPAEEINRQIQIHFEPASAPDAEGCRA